MNFEENPYAEGEIDLAPGDPSKPYARIAATLRATAPCAYGEYAHGNGSMYADLGILRVEVPFAPIVVRADAS